MWATSNCKKSWYTPCYWVHFRHSPLYCLFSPPPPLPMLYEIREDIQPRQHQHWKGERGDWSVQHCLLAFYSALFAGNRVNAESVSSILIPCPLFTQLVTTAVHLSDMQLQKECIHSLLLGTFETLTIVLLVLPPPPPPPINVVRNSRWHSTKPASTLKGGEGGLKGTTLFVGLL